MLDKPSYDNADKIQTVLEATETELCSICFHENDKTGTEACVNWVACTKCHTWIHTACAKPARSTLSMCVIIVCISKQASKQL